MDSVLTQDFQGVKIRFIGDCVHGAIVEGTSASTDNEATTVNAVRCAGALRSSFELALEIMEEANLFCGLGLAIGMDFGPLVLTRLGIRGEKIRCCVGRAVLASEDAQLSCSGEETSMGEDMASHSPEWVRNWFGSSRKRDKVTYDSVETAKASEDKKKTESTKTSSLLRPAVLVSTGTSNFAFPNKPSGPVKPAGFA
jgi:hypothetical protein